MVVLELLSFGVCVLLSVCPLFLCVVVCLILITVALKCLRVIFLSREAVLKENYP